MRVSPSARALPECAKFKSENPEFNISLLDCRYLAGDENLFNELHQQILPAPGLPQSRLAARKSSRADPPAPRQIRRNGFSSRTQSKKFPRRPARFPHRLLARAHLRTHRRKTIPRASRPHLTQTKSRSRASLRFHRRRKMPRPFPPRPRRQRSYLRTAIRSRRTRPRRPTRHSHAARGLDAPLFPSRPRNLHPGHATPRRRRPRKKFPRRSRRRMESQILEFAIRNLLRPPGSPRASRSRQRSRATSIALRSNGPRRPKAKPRNRAGSRIRQPPRWQPQARKFPTSGRTCNKF